MTSETGLQPLAAWQHNNNVLQCIGHTAAYEGGDHLDSDYVYPGTTLITSRYIGHSVLAVKDEDWASEKCSEGAATAIIHNDQGIIAAWEPPLPGQSEPRCTVLTRRYKAL